MVADDSLALVLRDFARTMLTDFPIQKILDHLVERIVAILPVSAAGVTLIEPGQRPRYVAASDENALRFEQLQSSLGEGPCLTAAESGEPVLVPDLRGEHPYARFGPAAIAAGMAAVFTFPLRHDNGWLGALDLYRDEVGPISDSAQLAAQTLADVAAAYIINAQAREESAMLAGWLHDQSLHDLLTGLPNRALLRQRLQHASERARLSRSAAAVVFLDLDHFTRVNEAFGHDVGDQALVAVAQRLSALTHPGDTLARVSGDEFVFLVEDLADATEVDDLLDRIDAAFAQEYELSGVRLSLSASAGVAYSRPGADITDDLVIAAGSAMDQAKNGGRTAGTGIDFGAARQTHDLNRLERDLTAAFAAGDLHLRYQPRVRARGGEFTGVEALLYWTHPTLGHIPAPIAVAAAERGGTSDRLNTWVLERSCRDWLRWSAGRQPGSVDLSVNVSARQLMSPGFPNAVSQRLTQAGMSAPGLILEVTETILIEDGTRALRTLQELKALGIRIALDNFGSGLGAFNCLRRYPLDFVKIDRSLVSNMASDPSSASMVAAITDLSHTLNMTVVAAGVETTEQRKNVVNAGCDLAQGYLFAQPMSAAALSAALN
ncbi:putative bifunctional diguanylate cyclase/phosphodiesterase [Pengzhenrongella sicca]|uniref:Bifunctional diguanylate cyclase/phosphodiesterase n=1 Tax=Pengzhenrongella sicca TaxID=2819238 RepID=A0A8A4ZIS5_9MICO|nr:GGDEF domain-containing protein [Pengzhenrongella sicca]QTE31165.1 bifunctional diguanylate cyclase/phosphodiesterase [Pengzhenrongella sicca]